MAGTTRPDAATVLASIKQLTPKDYRALKESILDLDAERHADAERERMRKDLTAQARRMDEILARSSAALAQPMPAKTAPKVAAKPAPVQRPTATAKPAPAPKVAKTKVAAKVKSASGRTYRKPVKYRNPLNANEGWSGFGPKPQWLASQIKSGKPLESFLVQAQG